MRRFKFWRKYKGGIWFKTKERGWIRPMEYGMYLGYDFDPLFITEEVYE